MSDDFKVRDFREHLLERAAKVRSVATELGEARKIKTELSPEQLKAVLDLLREHEIKTAGKIKFVVDERDEHGRIKSFYVERIEGA